MRLENCYFELKNQASACRKHIVQKSNVYSSRSLCRVLWIFWEFVKTNLAAELSATGHILISVSYDIMCYMIVRVREIRYQWMSRHTCCQRYLLNLAPLTSCTAGVFDFGIPLLCSAVCLRAIFSSSINRRCHLLGGGGGHG